MCGYGYEVQLGVGDTDDRVVPTLVQGELAGRKVLHVAAGMAHTLCLTGDGMVFAFGSNNQGQLGVGGNECRLVPTLLTGELKNKSVVQVAAGYEHTIFVTGDGLLLACGDNRCGKLGVGDTETRLVPTLVTGQLQGKTAVHAAAGVNHTLCITADGSLFAWGYNDCGQLGVGDADQSRVPTLVTGLQGEQVVHVAAGESHTICTTADGSVFTWGNGSDGQLGDGRSDFEYDWEWDEDRVPTLVRAGCRTK